MANEGYGRTFAGDPNPPARPPEAPAVSTAPVSSEEGGGTAVAARPQEHLNAGKPGAPVEIRAVRSNDGFDLFMATDEDPAVPMGRTRLTDQDHEGVLRASGAWYNKEADSWEGVPEETAKALLKGRPGLTDFVIQKFKNGEAQATRSALGAAMLRGEVSREDAIARGHVELLKVQLDEEPALAWKGLGGFAVSAINVFKNPGETLRFMAGEAAEQAPYLIKGLEAAAKGGTKGAAAGGAAAGAALLTGPVGLPVAAAAVIGGANVGATYEAWKFFSDTEAGSTAMEMAEKGFDDKTIRELAPLAGIIKGTLETASFGVMTAPLKRGFIKTLAESAPIKTALAKWYVTYAATMGAEVSTELAQTRVDQVVQNYAAQVEEKPEMLLSADKVKDQLWTTFVKTIAGTAVTGAPGAAIDAGVSMVEGRVDAKAQGELGKAKAAQAKKVEAALAPVEAPKEEPAPAAGQPGGKEVIDPAGDYLPRAEKATAQVDEVIKQLNEDPTSAPEAADTIDKALTELDARPKNYGEKIIEAETKALLETRRRELTANQAQITALQKEQARYERNDMGTKVILGRIDNLLEENATLRGDIEFYSKAVPQQVGIEATDDLTMKPATLENLMEMGFKEGRKEVLGGRRKAVLDVAKRLELTSADLRGILKDKNYGTMGDEQFDNWMESTFRPAALKKARRKVIEGQLRRKQAEKRLESERNIRLMHELPSVEKMTDEQLFEYMEMLDTYDRGDRVLSPKRQRALATTAVAGARTMGEVAKRTQELWGYPVGTVTKLLPEPSILRPDTTRGMDALAKRSPAHKAMVLTMETAIEAEDAVYMAEREKLMELGAKALASRKSLAGRVFNPTMPEVVAHLEADDGQVYAGQVNLPDLTPAEQELVDFIDAVYAEKLDYLVMVEGLKSRFTGKYFTHMKREMAEIIADIKDVGVRKTLKELLENALPQPINFSTQKGGKSVGLRAHMKQTMFRTGDLKPSMNVIRVFDGYLRAFHKKKALDRAVPQVDTQVDALIWADKDKTADGQARKDAFDWFMGLYLKQKKGQTILADAVPHGGIIDMVFRGMMALPSWAWIAFNPKLQAAAKVGEVITTTMVTGHVGLARAWRLRWTEKGAAFLAANEGFTGTPIVKAVLEPGKSLGQSAGLAMFGILQMHRVNTMQDILLAMATPEEINSNKISAERLAEIKVLAARWIDVKGAKSVLGATSPGAMLTQFKGWGIPVIESTYEDLVALGKQVAGGEKMTDLQKLELQRLVANAAIAFSVAGVVAANVDEDDESWTGQFLKGLLREFFSVTGGANPLWLLSPAPAIGYYIALIKAANLLIQGWIDQATGREEQKGTYQTGDHEGENMGKRALARLLPGRALARQVGLTDEGEK